MNAVELPTLKRVIERLELAKIPYMLTGSMALNFYGQTRATNDFDIVIELQPIQKHRLIELFQSDFVISEDAIDLALQHGTPFNIIDQTTVYKIDFMIKKHEPLAEEQFSRRQEKDLFGLKAQVISPEDLILAKLQWSAESLSEMQERDIKHILRFLSQELDFSYLEKWADAIGQLERLRALYA